jgi:hypothetical protein
MLSFDFDTSAAQERIKGMVEKIRDLSDVEVPKELTAWQTEDMRRHFPHTDHPTATTSETTIYPRSHTYEQTHKARPFKQRRATSAMPRLVGATGRPASQRPILREALYDKLVERMSGLMTRVLSWRSTSRS